MHRVVQQPGAYGTRWFHSLAEAQAYGITRMHSYNTTHAHSALGYQTPEEFLATLETTKLPQICPAS